MAEDALGYIDGDDGCIVDVASRKNILIVDDINDSGATINWIVNDWMSGCLPSDSSWESVRGNNVRYAVMYNNESSRSELEPSYSSVTINKHEYPEWIVFPWENFWKH
jgi:hypoxanthine phosphoribosyltransferase